VVVVVAVAEPRVCFESALGGIKGSPPVIDMEH
jgi:hypothetical protein